MQCGGVLVENLFGCLRDFVAAIDEFGDVRSLVCRALRALDSAVGLTHLFLAVVDEAEESATDFAVIHWASLDSDGLIGYRVKSLPIADFHHIWRKQRYEDLRAKLSPDADGGKDAWQVPSCGVLIPLRAFGKGTAFAAFASNDASSESLASLRPWAEVFAETVGAALRSLWQRERFAKQRALIEEAYLQAEFAERAAQEEAAKLWAMISTMQEGVVFADESMRVVEANEFFASFVGKKREDLLGCHLRDVHPPHVYRRICRIVESFRNRQDLGPVLIERRFGALDVVLRVQPIYRDSEYRGVLLNVVDVTPLMEARRQIEQTSRAKSEFLANMSHEIRTPLTSIIGYAEIIRDIARAGGDHPSCREVLDATNAVLRNSQHLLELINDILDLAKIEAGALELERVEVPLPRLISDVLSVVRPKASEKKLSLRCRILTPVPDRIYGDAVRLRQVLVNLVGNAVKFTERGFVEVKVSGRQVDAGTAELRIEVVDTGPGIPPDKLDRIFEPFRQADGSITRKHGGTGLGLSVVKRLTEAMGGKVTARSAVGLGSVFVVELPVEVPEDAEWITAFEEAVDRRDSPADDVDSREIRLEGKILLAEDGIDNQRLIKRILESAGAEVKVASNGKEAVDLALAEPFDLILMDISMPEVDGLTATRMLRSKGVKVPIVALTGHVLREVKQECVRAGCNAHLSKPIRKAELLEQVARWLSDPRGCEIRIDTADEPAGEPSTSIAVPTADSSCKVHSTADAARENRDASSSRLSDGGDSEADTGRSPEGAAGADDIAPGRPNGRLEIAPLRSSVLEEDPDLKDLVEQFVAELPQRLEAMLAAWREARLDHLRTLAHQLKGAAGGYGYREISDIARMIEASCQGQENQHLGLLLDNLEDLIARAQAGLRAD